MNIDELNIKISSNTAKAKNGIDKLKSALAELGAVDTSNLAKLVTELDSLGKSSNNNGTAKQSSGVKKIKVSVENTTPKITELRKELSKLSEQGLSFGDDKFDKAYSELQKAKDSLKDYKKNLIDANKSDKSQSKLDEEAEKAKRLDAIIQKVVDREKELTEKANSTLNEVASYGKDKVETSYKDTPSAKGTTLGNYFADNASLKQLQKEMAMPDEEYKVAFDSGSVHRSAQDWIDFSNEAKQAGTVVNESMNKASESVVQFNSKTLSTNGKIEKVKQELADLNADGYSFGDRKFDKAYSKLVKLQYELTDYKKTLKDASVKSKNFSSIAKKGFANVGKVLKSLNSLTKKFAKNAVGKGIKPLSEGIKRVKNMFKNMLTRSILYSAMSAVRNGFGILAKEDKRFNSSMSRMYSALMQFKNGFVAMFAPALEAVEPIITRLLTFLSQLVTKITQVFGALTGGKTVTVAKRQTLDFAKAMDESSSKTNKAAEANKKFVAGFDELNVVSSNSSQSSDSNTDDSYKTVYTTTGASQLAKEIKDAWENADFTSLGEKLSSKIVSALQSIDWENIKQKAFGTGKSLATFINGLFKYTDEDGNTLATSIGKTLGEALNTLVNFIAGFVENLEWKDVGTELGKSINKLFKTIDWNKAGKTLGNSIKGLLNLITKAIEKVDWALLARDIVKFVKSIDWNGVSDAVFEGLGAVFGGLCAFLGQLLVDAVNNISTYFSKEIEDAGGNVGEGILNGIKKIFTNIGTWCENHILKPFVEGFNLAFDIHSPSKAMEESGQNIWLGVLNGIEQAIADIKEWVKTHIFDKFQDAINKLGELKVQFGEKISSGLESWRNWFERKSDTTKKLTSNFVKNIALKLSDWRDWFDSKKNNSKFLVAKFSETLNGVLRNWRTWFDNKSNNLKNITAKFGCYVSSAFNNFIKTWNSLKDKVINLTYNITQRVNNIVSTSTISSGNSSGSSSRGGLFSRIGNWFKGLFHADGGFPTSNDIFFANENGVPEYIGRMGRRTAVANNDQIQVGIANAVYDAIISAGGLFNGQNQQPRAVANINLKVKEETISKAVYDYQTKQLRQGGVTPSYV